MKIYFKTFLENETNQKTMLISLKLHENSHLTHLDKLAKIFLRYTFASGEVTLQNQLKANEKIDDLQR
jgi:hypothetical protein